MKSKTCPNKQSKLFFGDFQFEIKENYSCSSSVFLFSCLVVFEENVNNSNCDVSFFPSSLANCDSSNVFFSFLSLSTLQSTTISLIINSPSKPVKVQTATKLSIRFVTLCDKSESLLSVVVDTNTIAKGFQEREKSDFRVRSCLRRARKMSKGCTRRCV